MNGVGGESCLAVHAHVLPFRVLVSSATRKAEPAGGVCAAQIAHRARQMRRRRLQFLILLSEKEKQVAEGEGRRGGVRCKAPHARSRLNAALACASPCAAARRYNRMASALSCATP